MRTLHLHQNYTTKDDMHSLKQIPRLTYIITYDRQSRQYPSTIDLITLSTNLTYKAHLILNNEAKCKKELSTKDYLYKAIELHKILDDYRSSFINMREFNQIKKKFGLNGLYKVGKKSF